MGVCGQNSFKFSASKTVHQHYIFVTDPNILLGKTLASFLDTKLTFKNHVQYLKSFGQKALDILQVVGHTDWGTDHIVLLCLYYALVHSKLDYGDIVYGLAHRSVLRQLNLIHHQGFNFTLGAFCTSPAQVSTYS